MSAAAHVVELEKLPMKIHMFLVVALLQKVTPRVAATHSHASQIKPNAPSAVSMWTAVLLASFIHTALVQLIYFPYTRQLPHTHTVFRPPHLTISLTSPSIHHTQPLPSLPPLADEASQLNLFRDLGSVPSCLTEHSVRLQQCMPMNSKAEL